MTLARPARRSVWVWIWVGNSTTSTSFSTLSECVSARVASRWSGGHLLDRPSWLPDPIAGAVRQPGQQVSRQGHEIWASALHSDGPVQEWAAQGGGDALCGAQRWIRWGSRSRQLKEYSGEQTLWLPRRSCRGCGHAPTVFPPEVVPGFRYARPVIVAAMERRQRGNSWAKSAEACTTDGLVEPSTVRHWARRLQLNPDVVRDADQQLPPFTPAHADGMLPVPDGNRRPTLNIETNGSAVDETRETTLALFAALGAALAQGDRGAAGALPAWDLDQGLRARAGRVLRQ